MEKITLEEYMAGIEVLVPLAQSDTGGARVAAQVLLSAYNGESFQLDITDLGNLDQKNYIAALAVIRGRTEHRTEPHKIVFDGDTIFPALWKQWLKYHTDHRWKPYCSVCRGLGLMYEDQDDENNDNQITCTECNGVGFLKD